MSSTFSRIKINFSKTNKKKTKWKRRFRDVQMLRVSSVLALDFLVT